MTGCRAEPTFPRVAQSLRRLTALVGIGVLAISVPLSPMGAAWAQQPAAPDAAPASPAPAPAPAPAAAQAAPPEAPELPVTPQEITLDIGRGQMVQLPAPAASVYAADPGVARVQPVSPTRLFLIAAAVGHTTVIATNSNGGTISQLEVTVRPNTPPPTPVALPAQAAAPAPTPAPAAEPVPSAVGDAAAAERAITQEVRGASDVHMRSVGKDFVLTGVVPTPAGAQEAVAIAKGFAGEKGIIIDRLLVLTSIQVNVRVRFAEIDRTITRQLGLNWQSLAGQNGGFQLGLATGALASGGLIGGTLASGSAGTAISVTAPNGAAANLLQLGNTHWDVSNIIDALAADQLVTVLAEPNLTALSGETASFLAGGEFPVPVAGSSSATGTTISIDFKQFGVSLSVTPTVIASDRLNLRVRPEVSSLSTAGAISTPIAGGTLTIPALSVSRAETTIELGSGQSFAIAGLLKKTNTDSMSGLPGIGEVPVLGALFRSDAFQREETELVIIVTPYIVAPVSSPGKLRAPTDGFKPAIDLDRILFGRQIARGSGGASQSLDAGFILR